MEGVREFVQYVDVFGGFSVNWKWGYGEFRIRNETRTDLLPYKAN